MTRAVVVGGGIGGLAAAIGLRRVGVDVTVLERSTRLGEIGAGMSQSPNALRALDALGVGEAARAAGVAFHATTSIRTPDGRHLVRTPPGTRSPLLGFHRADLHRLLLEAIPAANVEAGVTVTSVSSADADATVVCADGRELTADLVVAADGVGSTVRKALWPQAPEPKFWGNTVWRGVAAVPDGIDVEGGMTMGRGQYFLIMPLSRGRVYWALATRAAEPGIRYDDEPAEVRRRLTGWHDPIGALLDATPPGAVLHHDMADLQGMPSYVTGRVALLGDAAHAMHPDMAQGAAQALEDAVVLAASLAAAGDVGSALDTYDHRRRPRTQTIVRQARGKALMSTTPSRIGHALQTLLPAVVPSKRWPALTERALAPVWGWKPPEIPRATA